MAEHLDQYTRGSIGLDHLISGLDALLGLLEDRDKAWTEAFRHEWGTLEITHAIALHHGKTKLLPDSQTQVDQAIEKMRRLLHNRIPPEGTASDG
jgi:hypothetical protein